MERTLTIAHVEDAQVQLERLRDRIITIGTCVPARGDDLGVAWEALTGMVGAFAKTLESLHARLEES